MAADVYLNPKDEFDAILIDIKRKHNEKKADYSEPENRFSNFEEAAFEANISPEAGFRYIIGIKTARLRVLTLSGHDKPRNEPLLDTILDRAVYCILEYAYHKRKKNDQEKAEEEAGPLLGVQLRRETHSKGVD